VLFVKFENFVSNRMNGDEKVLHSEITQTNMDDFGRRLMENDPSREIGIFGDDR